jgi:starch phosphorylase
MNKKIIYISPEFGIDEKFPNYAGGLGLLAGDYLRSCSDLNYPVAAIGLFYKNGYFTQSISKSGNQLTKKIKIDTSNLPIEIVKDSNGNDLIIKIGLVSQAIYAKVHLLKVGNIDLYLLDSNLKENGIFKNVTNMLYCGDRETRLLQEIILGFGSIRLIHELGLSDICLHINEGHAAFALFERTNIYSETFNISFNSALKAIKQSNFFTTHTPLIHGNEEFKIELIAKYLNSKDILRDMFINDFIELGKMPENNSSIFSMTAFSLRLSGKFNAVSKLHSEIADKMWENFDKNNPIKFIPITNGVHYSFWVSEEFDSIYNPNQAKTNPTQTLPASREGLNAKADFHLNPSLNLEEHEETEVASNFSSVLKPSLLAGRVWVGSDFDLKPYSEDKVWVRSDLFSAKKSLKIKLINEIKQYFKSNPSQYFTHQNADLLDENYLIIGFARRFAEYKRAGLIFENLEKLKSIVENEKYPVRFIFSGKAHPLDKEGKSVLKYLLKSIKDSGLENHIIFLEDYDIKIARLLVQGCDIWLNNPIRGLEACGTSGMKAALNGGINFSILDGWWDEAYNGKNGWAIGDKTSDFTEKELADIIYDKLSNEIIPLYYSKESNELWYNYMIESIKTYFEYFTSNRMAEDYYENFYHEKII